MTETKTHLKDRSTWKRALYMMLFAIIYSIAEVILTGIIIIQLVMKLFTGKINDRLLGFSKDISLYIYDMLKFLTFAKEEMPFPFTDWKKADDQPEKIEVIRPEIKA